MTKIGIMVFGLLMMASCSEAQHSEEKVEAKSTEPQEQQQQQEQVINKVVRADEFKKLMELEDRQLVDVRTPAEVAGGKIDGAVNIDINSATFQDEMSKLDREKPVLVYCRSGGRSARAAAMLKEMGFKEVYDLQGGYMNWPY